MNQKYEKSIIEVKNYFNAKGSRWGYSLILKGTKHFGYYPKGKENISMREAQILMEIELGKRLGKPKNSLILDAGGGEGNVAVRLSNRFDYRIEGVDLLDFAVNKANKNIKKHKLNNKIHFQVGDYTFLNFPDNYFDGIYTMETLVHCPDYKKSLREFYRVLKPGGKLVLFEYSIVDQSNVTKAEKELWDLIVKGFGMHSLPFFTHGKFPNILNAASFKNIKVEDISIRTLPMVKRLYQLAVIPYTIAKFLNLEKKFINVISAIEVYKNYKKDYGRYNIITAEKL